MLRKGQEVVVKMDASGGTRTIAVRRCCTNCGFNTFEYGISALQNDFDNEIQLRAALRGAKCATDVLGAVQRFARYSQYARSARLVA